MKVDIIKTVDEQYYESNKRLQKIHDRYENQDFQRVGCRTENMRKGHTPAQRRRIFKKTRGMFSG